MYPHTTGDSRETSGSQKQHLPERERAVLSRSGSQISESLKGETMKLQRAVFVLMGMMLVFAGKSSAQQVKTDYDRNANFAQYKTYSWEQVKTKDPLDVDPIKTPMTPALAPTAYTQIHSATHVSF